MNRCTSKKVTRKDIKNERKEDSKGTIFSLLKMLFPSKCLFCGKIDNTQDNSFVCKRCEKIYKTDELKKHYNGKYNFTIYFVTKYMFFRKYILDYKFNLNLHVAYAMADMLKKNKGFVQLLTSVDYVIPVPISEKKMNFRGFNQIEFVLKILQQDVDFEILNIVKKQKNISMFELNQEQRYAIKDLFCLNEREVEKLQGKEHVKFLLIDDIHTTGTSLYQIQCLLKETYSCDVEFVCFCLETN